MKMTWHDISKPEGVTKKNTIYKLDVAYCLQPNVLCWANDTAFKSQN